MEFCCGMPVWMSLRFIFFSSLAGKVLRNKVMVFKRAFKPNLSSSENKIIP